MSAVTLTQWRNALFTLLTDQQTATPTLLRMVFRGKPGNLAEKPCAWLDEFDDDLGYDAGTRARTMLTNIVVADTFKTDLITNADPFDALRDALIERFTANSAVIPSTVTECIRVSGGDISLQSAAGIDSVTYRGMTLTMRCRIWEGRD
jgi:hypothetical protein